MIYFTADLHGDRTRFAKGILRRLSQNDTLIVCGDFGFLWTGSDAERETLEWIGSRKFQVLFVEGCHDNLSLLEQYPAEEFCGGLARHICGNLYQLIRGQIFTIEGKKILAMGGGQSPDYAQREIGVTWWPQEVPQLEELPAWRELLSLHNYQVDYIVSHQAPTRVDSCLTGTICEVNNLVAYLDELTHKCSFDAWFFGNYHQNRVIPPKYYAVYDKAAYCTPRGIKMK